MSTIATYCGKPLDQMSREELIEALERVGNSYNNLLLCNSKNSRALALGKIEQMKRGEL